MFAKSVDMCCHRFVNCITCPRISAEMAGGVGNVFMTIQNWGDITGRPNW